LLFADVTEIPAAKLISLIVTDDSLPPAVEGDSVFNEFDVGFVVTRNAVTAFDDESAVKSEGVPDSAIPALGLLVILVW
jgi:hypothetical protein